MRRALLVIICLWLAGCAPEPTRSAPGGEPADARWIEVVLTEQRAYLWQDGEVLASLPVSTGVGISPETTTYTGEYSVTTMYRGPEQTAPGVYVRDIVIFDPEHGNGFHSLPMDADGVVLDPTVGAPASAGCVRVADSGALFAFAHLGMKVVLH